MISSKLTQNFSFNKLRNKIDDILDDYVDKVGIQYGNSMINRIKKGLKPQLAEWTLINNAREGITRVSNKPLMRTGKLLESLKYIPSQNAIIMKAYGELQNNGYKNPWQGFRDVPARPFMHYHYRSSFNYDIEEVKSSLHKRIREALRK